MTNEKVKGIVIKLIDYLDADKLASIFTLERGLITVKFTGVRRDKAKLKAVAQVFTLAEFNVLNRGDKIKIINADIIDNFPSIMANYDKMICGYIVLDMIRTLLPKEKVEEDIFLLTLSALKDIENKNEYVSTIYYILKFLEFQGMLLLPTGEQIYLDNASGEFRTTYGMGCSVIDPHVYATMYNISQSAEVNENLLTYKRIMKLLYDIIYLKYNENVKSFQFL